MTTCLITGGAGFIGSHLVDHLLKTTDWDIIVWDNLTYAGSLENIDVKNPRVTFNKVDINQILLFPPKINLDYIVHLAAETHVDRSIASADSFMITNIWGTWNLLERARTMNSLKKFLYFSTDEVFGPATSKPFHEWSRYNSSNPYAATKAAGEELALAWANTYNVPVVVSHCCNVFGERQHQEKFIPKLVRQIAAGETVTIHARPDGTSGSRMYVYAGDVARAITLILEHGLVRQKYNIPGEEIENNEMAVLVAIQMDMSVKMLEEYPYSTRPGWDFSYRIAGEMLKTLGWEPSPNFLACLRQTVESFKVFT